MADTHQFIFQPPHMRLLKRLLLGAIILLGITFLVGYFWMRSSRPDYNANLRLPGLSQPVEVLFDEHAIPHIYAQNEQDMYMALGYVHAQDRLFQMEVIRRLADGRLSEIFGEQTLSTDRLFRTMDFRRHAKMSVAHMMQDSTQPYVQAVRAYLKGVNEYVANGKKPVEFGILGIGSSPFTMEDVEVIISYMGYTFTGAFRAEAVATTIASKWGDDYLQDIFGNWPDSAWQIPVQPSAYHPDSALALTFARIAETAGEVSRSLPYPTFMGSNGWVVSGRKTQSGKPILANDTHIAFAQPSVWYEAHLECPGFSIYGNFLAGTPVPALGHSAGKGWGITMFENDDMDFYREKPNPQNPDEVWVRDHWEPLEVRNDIIRVKGEDDVVIELKRSRHGPILNGAFDGIRDWQDPIAMWWVHDQFPSSHLQAFYGLAHARNATEASKAVSLLTSPGLNIMWADTTGDIAWWAAGKLPIRPKHVNPNLILDGSSGNDDPLGWLPFSQNPQILNPERGVLYTANNQPQDMGSGPVAGYYVPSNRARRIESLLFNDKSDWTEASMRDVINDNVSEVYPELLRSIMPVIDTARLKPDAMAPYHALAAWDGSHELTDIEPAIFYRFLYMVYRDALRDELGYEAFKSFEHSLALKRNTRSLLLNDASKWWDNVNTSQRETRADIFTHAFDEAACKLENQLGDDMSQWYWELVHKLEHKHPLGAIPVIGPMLFNVGSFDVPGGQETINNLDFPLDSTGNYKVLSGPALRRIIDFGNKDDRFSVNPTGQSGHPLSPYYDDQAELFGPGGKRREYLDRKDVEKMKIGRTVLKP
jgi:penicillin amidase